MRKNSVAELMKENDIKAKTKRKFKASTNPKHDYSVAANVLNPTFTSTKPNQIFVTILLTYPQEMDCYTCLLLTSFIGKLLAGQ